ncbi:MAG: MazG nucleotide pyrophosphohydrolase domain-containing protein [Myxococcota bacterium]
MIELPEGAAMARYQRYIDELEQLHGWTEVDLVHNCFFMGEEVGELFKAIRKYKHMWDETTGQPHDAKEDPALKTAVAEEIVDVFNYLLSIANRMDIDLEKAFRDKNARNQTRTWSS